MKEKFIQKLNKFGITGCMTVLHSSLMVFALFPLLYEVFFSSQNTVSAFLKAAAVILLEVAAVDHFFKLPEPKLMYLLIFAVMYVLGLVLGAPLIYRTMFYLTAADLVVISVYTYFIGFIDFMKFNDEISDMPVTYMKRVQKTFFIVALILILSALAPAFMYGKEPLADYFNSANSSMSRQTVSEEEQKERWEEEANFTVSDNGYSEMFDELIHIPTWLLNIMDIVFGLIVLAFSIYFVTKFIRYLIHELMLHEKFETNDEVIYLDNADDTFAGYSSEDKESFFDRIIKSRQSVRRQYKNTIRSNTKGQIDTSYSPDELERAAGLDGDPEMMELHSRYEATRYGR